MEIIDDVFEYFDFLQYDWFSMLYFHKFSIKLILVFFTIIPSALCATVIEDNPTTGIRTTTTVTTTQTFVPNTNISETLIVTEKSYSCYSEGCFTPPPAINSKESLYSTNSLPFIPYDNLVLLMEAIKPKQIAAQGTSAISFGGQQLQILHNRITSLKPGKGKENRFAFASLATNSFDKQLPFELVAQNLRYNAINNGNGEFALGDNQSGLFVKAQVSTGDKDTTSAERGFDVDFKSVTFGLDHQFTNELTLGVASMFGQSDADFDSNGGKLNTNTKGVSVYGGYLLPNDFYVDAVFNYASNDYDNKRTIAFPGFLSSATSDTSGDQYGAIIGIGKDFYVDSLLINPYVRIEYLDVSIDSYTEQGGTGFAVKVDDQTITSLTSSLGSQMSKAFSLPWGIVSPGIGVEWVHQYSNDQRNIKGQFVDAFPGTGNFVIGTQRPDRDYFNLEASVVASLPHGQSAFLRYQTRLGQSDINNHTIEVFLKMQF